MSLNDLRRMDRDSSLWEGARKTGVLTRPWWRLQIALLSVVMLVALLLTGNARAAGPVEETKLIASDGDVGDLFGWSVGVSDDRVVVGARLDDDNGTNSGSVYVFEPDGSGGWTETAKLVASDGAADDQFGGSVAVSGDRVVVGARRDGDNGFRSGSVYVFEPDGSGGWTETAKLVASDGAADDQFGGSVAVSGDRIVAGARGDDDNGSISGSVYVFEPDGSGGWTETAKLVASDGAASDIFGTSVGVSGDRIVAGARGDDDNGIASGSAYVFEPDGSGSWAETAKLVASDGAAGDLFGWSVGVSDDRIVAGARGDDDNGSISGSAYVFEPDGSGNWTETAKLVASDGAASDQFGTSVAVSGDRIVVGSIGDDDNGSASGSAYVFEPDQSNQPPAISLAALDVAVNEGQTGATGGLFGDPDGDPLTITCDCSIGSIIDNGDGSWSWTGTPPDGPATLNLAVTATDPSGAQAVDSFTIAVANVAPTVDSITAPLDAVEVGTEIKVSGTFSDPGVLDTHGGVWDWGDGTTSPASITESDGSGTAAGAHTYTAAGVYTLTLTITDSDGDSGSGIFEFVVVYDPAAGFVTGGGWIDSPHSAYTLDPDLTGKARFGFVSKYQKGATVPSGETQFSFKLADLDFQSTEYEWMVVSGPKAQYKGSGTINQNGDYGFILTAWDGQVNGGDGQDKFRIKIWDKTTDEVIYDNQIEEDLDADSTTVIGGGSIVIHSG